MIVELSFGSWKILAAAVVGAVDAAAADDDDDVLVFGIFVVVVVVCLVDNRWLNSMTFCLDAFSSWPKRRLETYLMNLSK